MAKKNKTWIKHPIKWTSFFNSAWKSSWRKDLSERMNAMNVDGLSILMIHKQSLRLQKKMANLQYLTIYFLDQREHQAFPQNESKNNDKFIQQ